MADKFNGVPPVLNKAWKDAARRQSPFATAITLACLTAVAVAGIVAANKSIQGKNQPGPGPKP